MGRFVAGFFAGILLCVLVYLGTIWLLTAQAESHSHLYLRKALHESHERVTIASVVDVGADGKMVLLKRHDNLMCFLLQGQRLSLIGQSVSSITHIEISDSDVEKLSTWE